MKLILTLEDIIPRENVTKTVDFMLKEGMREPVAHALIFILAQTFVSNLTVDAQVGEGEFAMFTAPPITCGRLAVIIKRMFPSDSVIPIKMWGTGWGDFQPSYFNYDRLVTILGAMDMLYRKDVVIGQVIKGPADTLITVERPFSL